MKFQIGDKAWGIRAIDDDDWALYSIEIADYWIRGHNSYSGKILENRKHELKLVFSAQLVFKTKEEAEEVLKKLQLQSSIRLAANDEINRIIHG